jgi:hypothetical protein
MGCVARLCTNSVVFLTDELRNEAEVKHVSSRLLWRKVKPHQKLSVNMQYQIPQQKYE